MKVIVGASTFADQDKTPIALLESAGVEVRLNPLGRRWTETEAIELLQGVDGLLAGLEPLNRTVLAATEGRLKALARIGIGMDNVDQNAAREMGIKVSNTPDAPTAAVTEMTLAALLCLARELEPMNREMHAGAWPKTISRSLRELTVLVVGFGRIGRAVAAQLSALGCSILVTDPFLTEASQCPFPVVSLADGLRNADVISLHASGSGVLLGDLEFTAMKPGMILLNPARGGLVDEAALGRALDSGQVAKAWLDTFGQEPYTGGLRKYPQVLMTPHACTYTRECRRSMESEAVINLLRDLGLSTKAP